MFIGFSAQGGLLILGVIFAIFKLVLILGVTYLFVLLFLLNWPAAWKGKSLFAFAVVFGTLGYFGICGLYALISGLYRPSSFLLMVVFLICISLAFNRIELINPLLDAVLAAIPLTIVGVALVGGVHLVYTTGSLIGHLTRMVLTCAFVTVIGAVRNYVLWG